MDAFFQIDGDRVVPSACCRGPWDPNAMHAGPPSALLGTLLERLFEPGAGMVSRITLEVVRPVPLEPLRARTEILRSGRRVALAGAALEDPQGRTVMLARAWWMRTEALQLPPMKGKPPPRPQGPAAGEQVPFFPGSAEVGYHTAMEWRFELGGFVEPGPAVAWLRARIALIGGEPITPLARVLVAADSGNGVSAPLDPREFLFINTDLSVHLYRLPEGEWVCLDAHTHAHPNGVGLTETVLFDETGVLGRAAQSLLIARRA